MTAVTFFKTACASLMCPFCLEWVPGYSRNGGVSAPFVFAKKGETEKQKTAVVFLKMRCAEDHDDSDRHKWMQKGVSEQLAERDVSELACVSELPEAVGGYAEYVPPDGFDCEPVASLCDSLSD